MKLNVGCGPDIREGWVNLDPWHPAPGVVKGDARDLTEYRGRCDTVLVNHVLHLFDYDEADQVLDQCAAALERGGELVIVEAHVLGVIGAMFDGHTGTGAEVDHVLTLVSDDVEPTEDGKVLRWVTWHGTRRSLWSPESLVERLTRRGLTAGETEPIWGREEESFAVYGSRG